jgi:hypothetical protein
VNVWEILGIRATGDEREIKRAYATQLKTARPDEDPQRFQDLRAAYEMALRTARHAAEETVEEEETAAVTAVTEHEHEHDPVIVREEAPVYMAAWEKKADPQSEARRLWAVFLISAGRNPSHALKALDTGGDLLDLAVRDCFELCALQYCAGEGCDDHFRAALAEHFGWEHDCAFIAREMPDETHMMLSLLRAHRSWLSFSDRAAREEAAGVLLGLNTLGRWKLSDKPTVENLRAVAREIRWEHGEMLHFKLDRAVFDQWESKANGKRYFRQTAIQSALSGLLLWFAVMVLLARTGTYDGDGIAVLAACAALSFAAFGWFSFHPPAFLNPAMSAPWKDRLYELLHHTRYQPQWQYGWMGVFALASLWMFAASPGPVLVATLQVTLLGCALASAFANSAVFNKFIFIVAGALGILIGIGMSQGPFAAYGALNCSLAAFCAVMLAYRGGADLLEHFKVAPAMIPPARALWLAGAAAFIALAGTLPLSAQLTTAAAWAWLMAGMVLTRPTVHHFFAMIGAMFLNGVAGQVLNQSPLMHGQPMRSLSFGMIFIGIFMAVNMVRAKATHHQFS